MATKRRVKYAGLRGGQSSKIHRKFTHLREVYVISEDEEQKVPVPRVMSGDLPLLDDLFQFMGQSTPEPINPLEKRVAELEKRVHELSQPQMGVKRFTIADQIYKRFKERLEAEQFGKIVAIDTDLGEIVGIGDTVLDAYNKAKERTSKTKFAFRRVGYPYVYKH